MPLFTTYLGLLQRHTNFHPSQVLPEGAELVYVMRNRGNRAIEPPKMLLDLHLPLLKCKKDFEQYIGAPLSVENVRVANAIPDIVSVGLLQTFLDWVLSNPSEDLENVLWKGYEAAYLHSLDTMDSRMWMQIVASRCAEKNIVFVCYEKSSEHCHRRLLAEVMAKDYGVQYLGELKT